MEHLADAQARRWAELDPALPVPAPLADPTITARLPDGDAVECGVYHAVYDTNTVQSLWMPRVVWEATPLLGDTGAEGMAAALDGLRRWFDAEVAAEELSGTDTAVELYWPSRDVDVAPALFRHGFVPLSVLAVRAHRQSAGTSPASDSVAVRGATLSDLDELVALQHEELSYSLRVIGGTMRDNATELITTSMRRSVYFSGRVLLAESDGVAVGAADCGVARAARGTWIQHRLPPGQWGYIGTLSVSSDARGTGVGTALVDAAHQILDADTERGVFLFYDLANPLSAVFWPRKGYRPLWTKWVCKPAALLR
ncbi:GNAT family N-acetyltransferase [Haloechinothrix salitolerans]|uniref:GNAT family N-acetyltransferase n=1 Tax=Haloechinothrix salitolerans TaxID=926830 RepID=A0ABW2BZA9_9PSEU